jgi:two-component system response regulator RstA
MPTTGSSTATESAVRVLIVEDDARLAGLLGEFLLSHGFSVDTEPRGDRAIERIVREQPSLVLLDVMLPGASGFDVCRRVRDRYARGIVMLTASKAEVDQAVGLELGADDYVVKPVEPRILLARIRSVLRRLDGAPLPTIPAATPEITVSGLTLRRGSREVLCGQSVVDVTAAEFDILWSLAKSAGEVVTRDELYQQVRGTDWDGIDRGMDVHLSRLRQKLEACGFPHHALKSVRGSGYLLVKR